MRFIIAFASVTWLMAFAFSIRTVRHHFDRISTAHRRCVVAIPLMVSVAIAVIVSFLGIADELKILIVLMGTFAAGFIGTCVLSQRFDRNLNRAQ